MVKRIYEKNSQIDDHVNIVDKDPRSNWKDNEPRKLNFLLRDNVVL